MDLTPEHREMLARLRRCVEGMEAVREELDHENLLRADAEMQRVLKELRGINGLAARRHRIILQAT